MRFLTKVFIIFLLILGTYACKVTFSFSGANISADVKTYSVDYFQNKALLVVPYLSSKFTDKLNEHIRSKTGLVEMTNNDGDVRFEGQITEYSQRAIDIKKDETAASNRLTISVRVKFTNIKDDKFDYDSSFSNYADYTSDADFTSIEESLIDEIIEKIIEDIFNKAFVNW